MYIYFKQITTNLEPHNQVSSCMCIIFICVLCELKQSPLCLASQKRYFQIGSHFSVRRKKLKSLWLPSKRFHCMLFVRRLFVSLIPEKSSYYV